MVNALKDIEFLEELGQDLKSVFHQQRRRDLAQDDPITYKNGLFARQEYCSDRYGHGKSHTSGCKESYLLIDKLCLR